MLAGINQNFNVFRTNYVTPAINFSKRHKILVSAVITSVVLGAICYRSPQAAHAMKKNVKFVTVVLPIAYTLTFPVAMVGFVMAGAAPYQGYESRRTLENLFDVYCQSIVKVWQAWFKLMEIVA